MSFQDGIRQPIAKKRSSVGKPLGANQTKTMSQDRVSTNRPGIVCPFCEQDCGSMQMTYIYLRSSEVGEIPMRCTSCGKTWTSAIRLDDRGGIVLTPLRAGIDPPTTIH